MLTGCEEQFPAAVPGDRTGVTGSASGRRAMVGRPRQAGGGRPLSGSGGNLCGWQLAARQGTRFHASFCLGRRFCACRISGRRHDWGLAVGRARCAIFCRRASDRTTLSELSHDRAMAWAGLVEGLTNGVPPVAENLTYANAIGTSSGIHLLRECEGGREKLRSFVSRLFCCSVRFALCSAWRTSVG